MVFPSQKDEGVLWGGVIRDPACTFYFKGVLGFRLTGKRASADFLERSLSLEPKDLTITAGDKKYGYVVNEIKKSDEYQEYVDRYIAQADSAGEGSIAQMNDPQQKVKSIQFNKGDLSTAIHGATSTKITGHKNTDGNWDIQVTITDTYDFGPPKGNNMTTIYCRKKRFERLFKIGLLMSLSLLLLTVPQHVYGLAGLAEQSHDLYYTKDILIYFGNPSDTCSAQSCFYLYRADDRYGFDYFKNSGRLIAINAPTTDQPSYILGKSFADGQWIIYDIQRDEEIFHHDDFGEAVNEWKRLGFEEPKIVEMDHLLDQFEETRESKRSNRELTNLFIGMGAMFALPFLVIVMIVWAFF